MGIFLAVHEDQLSAQLVKFVFFDKLEVYIKDMLQEVWITFFLAAVEFNELFYIQLEDHSEVTHESANKECQWRSSSDAVKMGSLTKSL